MTRQPSLGVLALTKKGCALARRVKEEIDDFPVTLYLPEKRAREKEKSFSSFREAVSQAFERHDKLLFIMATGIVVRSVASLLESKVKDPAVLVMDEEGVHVISLLSGHLGGANDLAWMLGERLGARPVITTASDVSNRHAVDTLAVKYGLVLKDMEAAKKITAMLVDGEDVAVVDPFGYMKEEKFETADNPKGALVVSHHNRMDMDIPYVRLIPKDLVLGIGCRKGMAFGRIKEAIEEVFGENNLELAALVAMATVDVKAEEAGILEASSCLDVPMHIFSRDELMETEELFHQSDFVKKTIGTGAVAEPCGYLASNKGNMLVGKTMKDGITLSVWRMKANV